MAYTREEKHSATYAVEDDNESSYTFETASESTYAQEDKTSAAWETEHLQSPQIGQPMGLLLALTYNEQQPSWSMESKT